MSLRSLLVLLGEVVLQQDLPCELLFLFQLQLLSYFLILLNLNLQLRQFLLVFFMPIFTLHILSSSGI